MLPYSLDILDDNFLKVVLLIFDSSLFANILIVVEEDLKDRNK